MNRNLGLALAVLAATIVVEGCNKPAEKKAAPTSEAKKATDAKATDTKSTAAKAEPKVDSMIAKGDSKSDAMMAAKESKPAAADKSAISTKKPTKVKLPNDELVGGIPGTGELTLDDIKVWLDDPQNHETLELELPLGLAAAQSEIKGLKENPMTRAKVELGRQLYFDPRLSKDQSVSCASCHSPTEGYGAHTQFGVGILKQTGNRNSPVAYNRLLSDLQFWDGRAASLEEQAKGPIANPIEMGHTHEACLSCLKEVPGYVIQFDKIFGEINIDTVAKAIATFERALVTSASPFDYGEQLRAYAGVDIDDLKTDDPDLYKVYTKAKDDANAHPMSDSAVRGRAIFFGEKGSCTACHVGANLTDEKYHNIGVGMSAEKPDLGRFEITKVEADKGAFKTPTIRNVSTSAPYMHDGSVKTLEEVVEFYNKGGEPNQWLDPKIKKLNLTDQEKKDLVAFMEACTGDFPKVETARLPPEP